ncbi:MAG: hypothetical protein HWN80_08530 [Candidatus Lokiarchaeota archaeon]|nr:hypothetical protein [Candidatus Lokiarchaeota archaeon]
MNKKKTIAIKDPRLRKIRDSLREVISQAVYKEMSKLFESMKKEDRGTADGYERYWELNSKKSELRLNLKKSTIRCPACNFGSDRDVRYNLYDNAWYCVDCFKDYEFLYYVTMARKERGYYIGLDYDEEFARSFTEDDANIEYEIQRIKNAFEKIDVTSVRDKIELLHARTRREVINDIINAFFIARIAEDEKGFGEISHLLAPFFKKLRETGLYDEYQKNITLVSIEVSGKDFGLLNE